MHFASNKGQTSACQVLCALDGVEQNAVDNRGKTALDKAIGDGAVNCVRALLEFNIDTSEAVRVDADDDEIVHLLEEHRKRSVKIFVVVRIIFF